MSETHSSVSETDFGVSETNSRVSETDSRVSETKSLQHTSITTGIPRDRRKLPPRPIGIITQEIGEKYCQMICDTYPEVFDGKLGLFIGASANMYVKPGHEDAIMNVGVRPPAKIAYGLQDDIEPALDELYETAVPIDGRELFVASQVVPVVKTKNGKRKVRLCINYKNTINAHLLGEPQIFKLK